MLPSKEPPIGEQETIEAVGRSNHVGNRLGTGNVVVVAGTSEAPAVSRILPIAVCVVFSVTVPTVAAISPFTPAMEVTVAACGLPSHNTL